jgi:hypothetical protein
MSNRTWACIECGKSYRRDQTVESVKCAICSQECEFVHWKIRIPSPAKQKEWNRFWNSYSREKCLIEQWLADESIKVITLDILNQQWIRQ